MNRCNFRDFQNIGVNGARSSSMNTTVKYGLARNPETDQPLVVVLALIGNDVCNGLYLSSSSYVCASLYRPCQHCR